MKKRKKTENVGNSEAVAKATPKYRNKKNN